MDSKKDYKFWCNITWLILFGLINFVFFLISININYQDELIKEHMRFRSGFPTQYNWKASPHGILNCYLFNVTNSMEFLNGTDNKLKLQQIGPIRYQVTGRHSNVRLNHSNSTMTFRKLRYEKIEFDPEGSSFPDILNQTVITPNFVLLSAAARLHDWFILLRSTFTAIAAKEPIFINRTVYEFLWDFTTPILERMAPYIPKIEKNAGMLHNALRDKVEEYNVNIGTKHGFQGFFRINTMNNLTYFSDSLSKMRKHKEKEWCPIDVRNAFDTTVFPPYLKPADNLSVVAVDSCRVFQLAYDRNMSLNGFDGYRYVLRNTSEIPSCLDHSMGIPLHKGMFDVTNCVFNVPTAFSYPHFLHTSYNWQEHFEGLKPNIDEHQTYYLIEPITGITFGVKYRFQSNIPIPNMAGFSKDIQRFSGMSVPSFWYEYDFAELPAFPTVLMKITLFVAPKAQPYITALLLFISIFSLLLVHKRLHEAKIVDLTTMYICPRRRKTLPSHNPGPPNVTELSTFVER